MLLQRLIWRMQRVGWLLLGLFLLAGLLGLLGGSGPLMQAQVASDDARIAVLYPRFDRYVAPSQMEVRIAGDAVDSDTLTLAVDHRWVEVFEMYGISPQPEAARRVGADMVYRFAVTPGQALEIGFFGRPHHLGPLAGSVRVGAGERLAFSTFVFP